MHLLHVLMSVDHAAVCPDVFAHASSAPHVWLRVITAATLLS